VGLRLSGTRLDHAAADRAHGAAPAGLGHRLRLAHQAFRAELLRGLEAERGREARAVGLAALLGVADAGRHLRTLRPVEEAGSGLLLARLLGLLREAVGLLLAAGEAGLLALALLAGRRVDRLLLLAVLLLLLRLLVLLRDRERGVRRHRAGRQLRRDVHRRGRDLLRHLRRYRCQLPGAGLHRKGLPQRHRRYRRGVRHELAGLSGLSGAGPGAVRAAGARG
jgi:hypothetical protein